MTSRASPYATQSICMRQHYTSSAAYSSHVAIDCVSYLDRSGKALYERRALPGWTVPLSVAAMIFTCETKELLASSGFMGDDMVIKCWPRYVLRIADTVLVSMLTDGTDSTVHVLVSEKENARMERYLAGTDSPLYDFLEELRFNPNTALGAMVKEAAAHFTEAAAGASESDL